MQIISQFKYYLHMKKMQLKKVSQTVYTFFGYILHEQYHNNVLPDFATNERGRILNRHLYFISDTKIFSHCQQTINLQQLTTKNHHLCLPSQFPFSTSIGTTIQNIFHRCHFPESLREIPLVSAHLIIWPSRQSQCWRPTFKHLHVGNVFAI